MGILTTLHLIGAFATLIIIMCIGVYSGKKVKSTSDFISGGHRSGSMLVAGTIIGTLVGGSSTIGTAQLAYTYGLSAWWFTIGAGLGCLILGLCFTKPLRRSNCNTIQQIITLEYGPNSGIITSILASFGILLNIVAQIRSANALLTSMFGLSNVESAIISIIIMSCYVIFGGVLGTGILGAIKLILIYISVFFGAIVALKLGGGFEEFYISLEHSQYFNIFSRGIGVDAGAGFSVILGVLSTQTYVQAILSGKNDEAARKGALISSFLIPPIGIGGILIGMYMRINFPSIESSQAFPLFIINNVPPLLGGVILATLLLALVGTGSGMALGFGTIITNDIYKIYFNKNASDKKELIITRSVIFISLIISAILTLENTKSTILTWGFMSMGLRATVLIVPMIGALFFKGSIDKTFSILSSILGFISFLFWELFINAYVDSLVVGIIFSIFTAVIGILYNKKHIKNKKLY